MENLKQIIDGDKDFNEYLQYIEVFLKQKCREGDYFGTLRQENISKIKWQLQYLS